MSKGIGWAGVALSMLLTAPGVRAGDLVLRDAAVYTVDARQPWASALVIHDGRIAYVGDEAGLKPFLEGAKVIDLHGAMVLPGFHDSHLHPMSGAMRLLQCDLTGATSLRDVEKAVRADGAAKPAHPWVFCNGIPEPLGAQLTRRMLDAWSPHKPAFIRDYTGFKAWANTQALAAAALPADATGALMGDDVNAVRSKAPAPSATEYLEALRRTSAMLNAAGVTSVFDAAATPDMLQAYHAADLAGELTLRVTAAQRVDAGQGLGQVHAMQQRRDAVQGRRFKADAAKIFLDGELDQHTACMLAPYADTADSRGPAIPQDQLDAVVQRLDAAGFLIHMHAMGDGAVRAGLDSIQYAMQKDGAADRRHQIAHVGVADPQDIPRFAKLGVIADFTPLWFQSDDAAFQPAAHVLGAKARWMYPMGSVVASGAHVTLGSDWPQETLKPLDEIQYAVTRQPLDGSKSSPQPEQRISVAQAIAAYTMEGAWAVREEKVDGTLEVGKAADVVVLDRNLFKIDAMSIHKARVLLTLLDGEPVYRDPQFQSGSVTERSLP